MSEIELYEPLPDEWDGPPTPEQLVLRFLVTMPSLHTRHSYGLDLGVRIRQPGAKEIGKPGPVKAPGWLAFCRVGGVDPVRGARQDHVALWARGMEAAGLSPATVARKLSAVSSWYDWMAENGYSDINPARRLRRPKVDPDTSKTPGLTKDQALAMLAGAADPARTRQSGPDAALTALRNAALTALLLYTGARVSEAVGATTGDLGMDRGHRVLWVTRKGGTREPLVLVPPVLERLDAYLAARGDRLPVLAGETARDRPLIATENGTPMRRADVWALMRRLGKAAGLPPELVTRMGAHSMRHSFATLALDADVSLTDLQDAMGHKDPRTTRRYDRARGRLDRSPGYTLAAYLAGDD